jgi:hypothetical protein
MDNKEIAGMTGQASQERTVVLKLNEIKMNGDTGAFNLRETLGEKGEDGKYPVKELGKEVKGVILKMRWRLSRFEEAKSDKDKPTMWMTSEYDNKNTDKVVLFNNNEKGIAADIKEKYKLGYKRVLYTYIPGLKQTVRIVVNASALSGDKNSGGELGLFEYVDKLNAEASTCMST